MSRVQLSINVSDLGAAVAPLGYPEGGLEDGGPCGQRQADDAGLGAVPGCQRADHLGGDAGGEEVEADRDELLGAPPASGPAGPSTSVRVCNQPSSHRSGRGDTPVGVHGHHAQAGCGRAACDRLRRS